MRLIWRFSFEQDIVLCLKGTQRKEVILAANRISANHQQYHSKCVSLDGARFRESTCAHSIHYGTEYIFGVK